MNRIAQIYRKHVAFWWPKISLSSSSYFFLTTISLIQLLLHFYMNVLFGHSFFVSPVINYDSENFRRNVTDNHLQTQEKWIGHNDCNFNYWYGRRHLHDKSALILRVWKWVEHFEIIHIKVVITAKLNGCIQFQIKFKCTLLRYQSKIKHL